MDGNMEGDTEWSVGKRHISTKDEVKGFVTGLLISYCSSFEVELYIIHNK
jgi:hypothetical protein